MKNRNKVYIKESTFIDCYNIQYNLLIVHLIQSDKTEWVGEDELDDERKGDKTEWVDDYELDDECKAKVFS